MRAWVLAVSILVQSGVAQAYDFDKCFKQQTSLALFKKYDYKYAGPWWITCRTSGKESSILVSTNSSIEQSTMSLDPGVSVGNMTSSSQFSSSWGECAAWGETKKARERAAFIAQNTDELKRDIAFGQGDHLDALAYFTDCDAEVTWRFAAALQSSFAKEAQFRSNLGGAVDDAVRRDPFLMQHCMKSVEG